MAGDSPVSGVYRSKQDFVDRAVAPITARLATAIVPEVQHVVAQGDAVVVGRLVRVVALLDTWALEALVD